MFFSFYSSGKYVLSTFYVLGAGDIAGYRHLCPGEVHVLVRGDRTMCACLQGQIPQQGDVKHRGVKNDYFKIPSCLILLKYFLKSHQNDTVRNSILACYCKRKISSCGSSLKVFNTTSTCMFKCCPHSFPSQTPCSCHTKPIYGLPDVEYAFLPQTLCSSPSPCLDCSLLSF